MSPSEIRATTDALQMPTELGAPKVGVPSRTERPVASRAHDAVLALGRRAIAAPDSSVLIGDAVRLIAEIAGTELALIARCEHATGQTLIGMTPEASVPAPDSSLEEASLADLAVSQAHPIVVPDLLHSKVHSDRYLVRNDIRGALIVPLRLQNASFGALGACSRERIDFEVDAIYVAETIAHLVATTLAHYRSETLLQENRRLNETLNDTIDAIVLVINSSGCVQSMNRACTEITGFTREECMDRPVWAVLAPPKEIQDYQGAIVQLTTTGRPLALEASLLTKHSAHRVIAWRLAASSASDCESRTYVLTGIDITKQRLAEERAERAKRALAHLRVTGEEGDDASDSSLSESGRSGELASGRRPTANERRLKPRRPFPYCQNIAYMASNAYPVEDEFFEVRCRDIAAGGFSFVGPTPPESDRLVVALGSPRHLTYLTARVVHVTQLMEDGKSVYLVGCQYTGRAPT